MDVEPDMVAGGQSPGRVVEPPPAQGCLAGVELRTKGRHLHPQAIGAAQVVAQHVKQRAAAPELLAVLELVDKGRAVGGVIAADDHEQAHAQADQPAGHPVEHEDGHGDDAPEALECEFHEDRPKQFVCR